MVYNKEIKNFLVKAQKNQEFDKNYKLALVRVLNNIQETMEIKVREKKSKFQALSTLMNELDTLYIYALTLIGTKKTHSLGYKKERFKQTIEDVILSLG